MATNTGKFYIETYGCEMNKSDSIDIALAFEEKGYTRATSPEEADVVILNTCAVRQNAEERIEGRIGFYRSIAKKTGKKQILTIAGCMAQEWGRKILDNYNNVSVVAGTYHYLRIPELVEEFKEAGTRIAAIDKRDYRFSPYRGKRAESFSAWVNIIKGCSNFCSYCIVPFLRGPEKSKPHEEIIREVKELVKKGVVEITLLGQNVNVYGRDNNDITFVELLEALNDIEGLRWIRFLTSHPKDFTPDDIYRISGLDKVCREFHLPLQSGSDKILKMMNRKYTVERYLEVVDAIKEYMDDYSLTTDIIVGFPGETEKDYEMTLKVVEKVRFDDAFMYKYSDRPFTRASKYNEKVSTEVAKRRLEKLINIQRKITLEKNIAEIGKEFDALVTRPSKKRKNEMLCRIEKGKMVVVNTDKPAGSFIKIRINEISGNTLRGIEL